MCDCIGVKSSDCFLFMAVDFKKGAKPPGVNYKEIPFFAKTEANDV